jgi:peptide/nickel transport system ATP-binding protein
LNALTPDATRSDATILAVENLSVTFHGQGSTLLALDNLSLSVRRGEIVSLVGESGCGKSVTAMAIMGLLPRHATRVTADAVRLGDTDLLGASERQLRRLRGNRIGMVFQDPMSSLNPVHTIGMQIAEVVRKHKRFGHAEANRRALEMLDLVRIPDARNRLSAYPHELSGGMRQRVMIAIALACNPELLIADEPTTALDVTVQAQIIDLIGDLRAELGMSVILITHDLGVVAATADRMAVMYAGRIVEEGVTSAIFARPSHGYTAGLMQSLPAQGHAHRAPLAEIAGTVPRLERSIEGCAFAPRCRFAADQCRRPLPPPASIAADHRALCVRPDTVFDGVRGNEIVRQWA